MDIMDNITFLTEFYKNKNYKILKDKLINANTASELEYLALVYMQEKNYAAASEIYRKIDMPYEHGRCELLLGNIDNTKYIWKTINDDSPQTLWGRSLLEFINLYVIHIPTFFQIRAFLEVDLDDLLNAGQIPFCENIVNGAHIFEKSNQESYKFIGRVFVNNKYFDLAKLYLNKAKDICYIDPEVHFLLAKCYLNDNKKEDATKELKVCLDKGYNYFPAKKLLDEINIS